MPQQFKELLMADEPAIPDQAEQRNVSICCDDEAAFHVPHQADAFPPTRVNVARWLELGCALNCQKPLLV